MYMYMYALREIYMYIEIYMYGAEGKESGYNIYLTNILDSLSNLHTLLGRHVN